MFEKIPDILTVKECQQLLKIGKNTMLNCTRPINPRSSPKKKEV